MLLGDHIVATLLFTHIFLLLCSAICPVWERARSLSHKVTETTYFSHGKFPYSSSKGRLKGWQGTFAFLSFTAPPPQCKKSFSSKSLSSRQKIICKLLHHLCSLIASLISLFCESLLIDEGHYRCSLHVTLKVWFAARVSCSSFNMP